jgi:signal transduction protein with GAF and PtsI domain
VAEGIVKFLTAILSLNVVIFFWRLMRQALTLPSPVNLLPSMTEAVSEATGWEYGEVWISEEEGKVLECGSAWYGSSAFEEFRRVSQELRFAPDIGLPGRVWSTKQSEWLTNISKQLHPVFLRAQLAKKAGFKTALGVPIRMDDHVAAVLVFLTKESRP